MTSTTNQSLWTMQTEISIEKATPTLSQRRILPFHHLLGIISWAIANPISNHFYHRFFSSPCSSSFNLPSSSLLFVSYILGTFSGFSPPTCTSWCWISGTGKPKANLAGPSPLCWFIKAMTKTVSTCYSIYIYMYIYYIRIYNPRWCRISSINSMTTYPSHRWRHSIKKCWTLGLANTVQRSRDVHLLSWWTRCHLSIIAIQSPYYWTTLY